MKPVNPSWYDLTKQYMAQGETSPNSKRPSQYVQGVYPTHIVRGEGPYIFDTEGNKYIDFVCSLGAILLGHRHPKVTEAVKKQIDLGTLFSLPSPIEEEFAEKLRSLIPSCEKVRYLKSGNEATLAAVRIARAYNQSAFVHSDGYHGHGDLWTSLTPPALGVADTFMVRRGMESGDITYTSSQIHIIEAMMLDDTPEWWDLVKRIRERTQILILDEVVTGGRVPKLTVSTWKDVRPNMICLGKGLANGYPLSVVGGSREVMDATDYFVSSTFSGDCVALAAGLATLKELEQRNLDDLFYYGKRFMDRFNEIVKDLGIELRGYGTRGALNTTFENTAKLMQECLKAGIFFGKGFFYGFQHLESEVEEYVLNIVSDVSAKIRRGEVMLEGKLPQQVEVRWKK